MLPGVGKWSADSETVRALVLEALEVCPLLVFRTPVAQLPMPGFPMQKAPRQPSTVTLLQDGPVPDMGVEPLTLECWAKGVEPPVLVCMFIVVIDCPKNELLDGVGALIAFIGLH